MELAIDVFDEFWHEMWDIRRRSLEPLTSISEMEDRVVIEVDLPLVKKENIQLRLVEGGLEIEASLDKCMKFERWGTVQRNCEFRYFYKLVPLPSSVVAKEVKATFKRGILRIELKKSGKTEYRIPIE